VSWSASNRRSVQGIQSRRLLAGRAHYGHVTSAMDSPADLHPRDGGSRSTRVLQIAQDHLGHSRWMVLAAFRYDETKGFLTTIHSDNPSIHDGLS